MFDSVYWILKMCQLFIRMLIVIWIMLICSLFTRINMFWTNWISFSAQVQTNTKEDVCLCTYKKVRITKLSFSKVFLITANNSFSKVFWITAKQIYRRQTRRRAILIMLLHSFIEIALLHGGLLQSCCIIIL